MSDHVTWQDQHCRLSLMALELTTALAAAYFPPINPHSLLSCIIPDFAAMAPVVITAERASWIRSKTVVAIT